MNQQSWKDEFALLFVVLVWGVNFPILKTALAVMPVFVVNAFRFIVSGLILGTVYVLRQRGQSTSFLMPLSQRGRHILGLGLLGYVIYQLCFILGLNGTTAGSAALIMASSPLWTALLGYVLDYEQLPPKAWFALVLSLVGTSVVVIGGAHTVELSPGTLEGNLLMLAASICWGAYTTLSKPVLQDVSPTGLTFFGLLFALPFLIGMSIPYLEVVKWSEIGLKVWGAIVFSGGLSTGLAFVFWNVAVRNVGPSHTAVFSNLVPFVALLASFVLLGESITMPQVTGGGLIVGGLLLMRRSRPRPEVLPEDEVSP